MTSVRFLALFGALLWCCHAQEASSNPPIDITATVRFFELLKKYGYFDGFESSKEGRPLSPQEQRQAIESMQRMAHLPVTGIADKETMEMLSKPRCGVKDGNPRDVIKTRRQRRYNILGEPYKWSDDKTDLTYKVKNYPGANSPDITREQVDQDVRAAFKTWSDVTPLTFTEVHTDDADIRIEFGARVHTKVRGDPPFDGPGGTLAHAFTPNSGWGDTDGDVHMDDDETFTQGVYSGTNLFYTLTHEIGHALGLFHSSEPDSLMWPYDRGYIPDFKLPQDDISGIQALYGPNPNPPVTDPPKPVVVPYCNTTFDATAFINNEYFMFASGKLWRFDVDRNLLSPPEGQSTREIFPSFPLNGVKAVYQEGGNGNVIVLKSKNFWVYEEAPSSTATSPQFRLKDVNPDTKTDFPKNIRELGFPRSVSGVVRLADVGFSYLLKGKKVYTFAESRRELAGPVKASGVFEGVTGRPTSAFFAEGIANVLVGEQYYRFVYDFHTSSFVALNGYPRNFAEELLRCPTA